MPSKADLPALGDFVRDLGIDIKTHGPTAWQRTMDWEPGPRPAPRPATEEMCTCGHGLPLHWMGGVCMFCTVVEPDPETGEGDGVLPCRCTTFAAASANDPATDFRADEAKQRVHAEQEHAAFVASLRVFQHAAEDVRRHMDRICPPLPGATKRDPETAAEVALDGFCSNCWLNDQQMVPITIDKRTGKPIFRDLCEWCGRMKNAHGFLPDRPILELRHAMRRVTPKDWEAAAVRHRARRAESKGKRKKGRKAA